MGNSFWIFIMIIVVTGIVADTIVKLVKNANGGGKFKDRIEDLEDEVSDLRAELDYARSRIETLEAVVTDEQLNLRREIDSLAADQ